MSGKYIPPHKRAGAQPLRSTPFPPPVHVSRPPDPVSVPVEESMMLSTEEEWTRRFLICFAEDSFGLPKELLRMVAAYLICGVPLTGWDRDHWGKTYVMRCSEQKQWPETVIALQAGVPVTVSCRGQSYLDVRHVLVRVRPDDPVYPQITLKKRQDWKKPPKGPPCRCCLTDGQIQTTICNGSQWMDARSFWVWTCPPKNHFLHHHTWNSVEITSSQTCTIILNPTLFCHFVDG